MTSASNKGSLYDRIAIIGLSGAGKTTLAVELAARLKLKPVELDALHWEANWVEAANEVMIERVNKELPGSGRWVTDGNYKPMRSVVWKRAQTLIWLDYSFELVMWRVIKRTVGRIFWNVELWNGNRETAYRLLSLNPDQNLLIWVWQAHGPQRARFEEAIVEPEWKHLNVLRFRTPAELDAWLAELSVQEVDEDGSVPI